MIRKKLPTYYIRRRRFAKDHLFKRSIILIKAWCYYESRVLGAHHGLISTYALETLVLYIFHQFHVSLDGPLAASSPSNLMDHTFSSKDGKENLHHMMIVMHNFNKIFVHSTLFPGSLQIFGLLQQI